MTGRKAFGEKVHSLLLGRSRAAGAGGAGGAGEPPPPSRLCLAAAKSSSRAAEGGRGGSFPFPLRVPFALVRQESETVEDFGEAPGDLPARGEPAGGGGERRRRSTASRARVERRRAALGEVERTMAGMLPLLLLPSPPFLPSPEAAAARRHGGCRLGGLLV